MTETRRLACTLTVALAAPLTGLAWSSARGAAADKPAVIVVGTPEPRLPEPLDPDEAAAAARYGVAVAQVSFVETQVDVRPPKGEWRRLPEGAQVHTGDSLRTGGDSVARLEFPWMSVSLAPDTELTLSKGTLLGLFLTAGRIELASGRDDFIKVDTTEVRVRGKGWLVVRRDQRATSVSVLRGEAGVRAGRSTVELKADHGCVVGPSAKSCAPAPLPARPTGLVPGTDPLYVVLGERLPLEWRAEGSSFHVAVLATNSEAVLLRSDVAEPRFEVAVPWPGLYRWRVSVRDAQGLEGPPALVEGLFQVMPRDWLPAGAEKR